jgi:hypothetical protein
MSFLKLLLWVLLPIALLGAGAFALIAWRRSRVAAKAAAATHTTTTTQTPTTTTTTTTQTPTAGPSSSAQTASDVIAVGSKAIPLIASLVSAFSDGGGGGDAGSGYYV